MKRSLIATLSLITLAAVFSTTLVNSALAAEITIKKIMKEDIKAEGSVWKKIEAGTATPEDQAAFLELCKALATLEPAKGEADSWKTKTQAVVDAMQGVVDGKEGSHEALKTAMNCKACHTPHKG